MRQGDPRGSQHRRHRCQHVTDFGTGSGGTRPGTACPAMRVGAFAASACSGAGRGTVAFQAGRAATDCPYFCRTVCAPGGPATKTQPWDREVCVASGSLSKSTPPGQLIVRGVRSMRVTQCTTREDTTHHRDEHTAARQCSGSTCGKTRCCNLSPCEQALGCASGWYATAAPAHASADRHRPLKVSCIGGEPASWQDRPSVPSGRAHTRGHLLPLDSSLATESLPVAKR